MKIVAVVSLYFSLFIWAEASSVDPVYLERIFTSMYELNATEAKVIHNTWFYSYNVYEFFVSPSMCSHRNVPSDINDGRNIWYHFVQQFRRKWKKIISFRENHLFYFHFNRSNLIIWVSRESSVQKCSLWLDLVWRMPWTIRVRLFLVTSTGCSLLTRRVSIKQCGVLLEKESTYCASYSV